LGGVERGKKKGLGRNIRPGKKKKKKKKLLYYPIHGKRDRIAIAPPKKSLHQNKGERKGDSILAKGGAFAPALESKKTGT